MPPKRSPKVNREGALLKSWRQESTTGSRAKIWLIVRRATITLLALSLVGWLSYLLFKPFFYPKTYLTYFGADDTRTLMVRPLEFIYEDFTGYAALSNGLTALTRDRPNLVFRRLESLDQELDDIQSSAIRGNDTLVLVITAHGIVRDGEAYLAGGAFRPEVAGDTSDEGLYAVAKLLRRLDELPGGTKLVLLDAGRDDYAPRLGMAINGFSQLLKQEIERANTSNVWVLCSSSPGERSHVSPALRHSVFGYMCSTGLQGAADVDQDEIVDLQELYAFVRSNVADWVMKASGGSETQTPILLGDEENESSFARAHLIDIRNMPEIPGVASEINAAQDVHAQGSIVSTVVSFVTDRVAEFGVDPVTRAVRGMGNQLAGNDEKDSTEENTGEEANSQVEMDREAQRTQEEFELMKQDWQLTQEIAVTHPAPVSYAPDLWRLHLERLVWLEDLQQGGARIDPRWLVDELRSISQSLGDLLKKEKPASDEVKNVVDQLRLCRPTSPIAVKDAPTIALAEAIVAADSTQELPAKLKDFIRQYDDWLASQQGLEQLEKIRETSWEDDWRQYFEFQLLEKLPANTEFPLATIKLALEVRRIGERVAANLYWGEGWAAGPIEQADRLRIEAERLLFDQAVGNWQIRASENLRRARSIYLSAERQLRTVQKAHLIHQTLLSAFRDYLRWSRGMWGDSATRAPSPQSLSNLLDKLRDVEDVLDSSDKSMLPNLADLERIRDEFQQGLSSSVNDLASAPYRPGDAERLETLLGTALLTDEDREKCLTARLKADKDLMSSYEFSEPSSIVPANPVSLTTRRNAAAHLAVEWKFVKTYYPNLADPVDSFQKAGTDYEELLEQSEALGEKLSELPSEIRAEALADADLSDSSSREDRIKRLRHVARSLSLVDVADSAAGIAADANSSAVENSLEALWNARWFDLLCAARERLWRAHADATVQELEQLQRQAERYAVLARSIPGQPEPEKHVLPGLNLAVAQSEITLDSRDEAILKVALRSAVDSSVWIVAQYDPDLLEVSGVDWTLPTEDELRRAPLADRGSANTGYPYRPEIRARFPATLKLRPGQNRSLDVRVKRQNAAQGKANLVLRAIGQSAYLRHLIPVRLPGRQELEVSISDGRSARTTSSGKIGLFPNRLQDLVFLVSNRGSSSIKLTANLYAPQQDPLISIPEGALRASAAQQIMRRFGRTNPVALGAELTLPVGVRQAPISFDFESPQNKLLLGAESKAGAAQIALPYGLLLELIDQESQERTIRWFQFEIWKPKAFLSARAAYDPGAQELTVTLQANPSHEFPNGDSNAELVIDSRFLSARGGGLYATTVREGNFRGTLIAPLNGNWPQEFDPQAEDYLPVYITVDGYPRAFEFRIRETTARTDLKPVQDISKVRIVSPPAGTPLAASGFVKARLEVDAPDGFFDPPENYLEVGIDVDQDRELNDENSKRLHSDRFSVIRLQQPVSNGTLAFEPRVRDFELELPSAGIIDRAVNVLGQLKTVGGYLQKDYVPIILDGRGPQIGIVKLDEGPSKLIVEVNPDDLTGVESVEAAFESSKEVKWEKGKRQAGSLWVVALKTADLSPGAYTVLIKATDTVGNVSEILREEWTKPDGHKDDSDGTSSQATKIKKEPVKNQVKGRVTYSSRKSVSDLKVTLSGAGIPSKQARILENGQFDFGLIPPGTYTVNAHGLAGGNYHDGTEDIRVGEEPNTPVNIEIKIR